MTAIFAPKMTMNGADIKLENEEFEYVFHASNLLVTATEPEETGESQCDDIVYTSDTQTILLHNGEYYIQTNGETLLVGNEQDGIEQLVINENAAGESLLEGRPDSKVIEFVEEAGDGDSVIYKLTDGLKLLQGDDLVVSSGDDRAGMLVDEQPLKRIKLEDQVVEFDGSGGVGFDIEKQLRLLEGQDGIGSSRYQYAILKDGKLQLCDSDSIHVLNGLDDVEDPSQPAGDPPQESCESPDSNGFVDLSKVTGRNLITGQTVTLDDYLERIQSKMASTAEDVDRPQGRFEAYCRSPGRGRGKRFINKKFTIGKTPAGKRLVGKIVHITVNRPATDGVHADVGDGSAETDGREFLGGHGGSEDGFGGSDDGGAMVAGHTESSNDFSNETQDGDSCSSLPPMEDDDSEEELEAPNVQMLTFDKSGKVLKVSSSQRHQFNERVTLEHVDFLSKTLTGLAELPSIRKKLVDRELCVKLVEKTFDHDVQCSRKVVTHLKGYLLPQEGADAEGGSARSTDAYVFMLGGDADGLGNEEEGVNGEGDDAKIDVSGHCNEEKEKKRFADWTTLSIIVSQDPTGHKTTRVNFFEKSDTSTTCKMCDRVFKSAGHLNRHLVTSHSDKVLTCHICQEKFADVGQLARHRRNHEHYFVCANCDKIFTTQGSLRRHVSVHDHSLRPLECTICGARFTDESSLCKHLIIHTGIKAYQCQTCKKAFGTVGDLNFHRRIHDPVNLFNCHVCGRKFSRHSNLLRHTEIHKATGGELYKCEICGCSYKFVSSLTRHVVQNHMKKS